MLLLVRCRIGCQLHSQLLEVSLLYGFGMYARLAMMCFLSCVPERKIPLVACWHCGQTLWMPWQKRVSTLHHTVLHLPSCSPFTSHQHRGVNHPMETDAKALMIKALGLEPPKASLLLRFPEQLQSAVPEATTRHHTKLKTAGTETVATVASAQERARTSGKLHEVWDGVGILWWFGWIGVAGETWGFYIQKLNGMGLHSTQLLELQKPQATYSLKLCSIIQPIVCRTSLRIKTAILLFIIFSFYWLNSGGSCACGRECQKGCLPN